jgi:hypothetical protein
MAYNLIWSPSAWLDIGDIAAFSVPPTHHNGA